MEKGNIEIECANVLRIKNGKLVCADGSNVKKYLSTWAAEKEIFEDTPVNLIPQDLFIRLCETEQKYWKNLHCSFCSKFYTEVSKLIDGQFGRICNECIEICNEIIAESKKETI